MAFARIVPGIESGSVDCAITGTMSGNTLGLHAVTTHLYAMPLTWGLAPFGANKAAWRRCSPICAPCCARSFPG